MVIFESAAQHLLHCLLMFGADFLSELQSKELKSHLEIHTSLFLDVKKKMNIVYTKTTPTQS